MFVSEIYLQPNCNGSSWPKGRGLDGENSSRASHVPEHHSRNSGRTPLRVCEICYWCCSKLSQIDDVDLLLFPVICSVLLFWHLDILSHPALYYPSLAWTSTALWQRRTKSFSRFTSKGLHVWLLAFPCLLAKVLGVAATVFCKFLFLHIVSSLGAIQRYTVPTEIQNDPNSPRRCSSSVSLSWLESIHSSTAKYQNCSKYWCLSP
jgi:hypothetical protein